MSVALGLGRIEALKLELRLRSVQVVGGLEIIRSLRPRVDLGFHGD